MKQLFRKYAAMRLLAFFFENPRFEIHLRELARNVRMSPSTVLRNIKVLEKEGLVVRRRERNATFFKSAMSNEFKALKVAYTVSKMEERGVAELISNNSKGLSSILLYGSAARGEDDRESDYDFLVIAADCRLDAIRLSERLGRESNLQVYSISEWKRVSKENRAFYLEVISNSVALRGEKPVVD